MGKENEINSQLQANQLSDDLENVAGGERIIDLRIKRDPDCEWGWNVVDESGNIVRKATLEDILSLDEYTTSN